MRAKGSPTRGWYVDPFGAELDRFWDGTRWTPRVRRGRTPEAQRVPVIGLCFSVYVCVAVWTLVEFPSWTAQGLAWAAGIASLNLMAALWLSRRYAGRPFGWNAEPWVAIPLICPAAWALPGLASHVPAWMAVAWWAACLPVPVWAALRAGRYPRWAPLPRWQAETALALLPLLLAVVPLLGRDFGRDFGVELAWLVPLLVLYGAPWLRGPAAPSFPVAYHTQPWWPRTPGWYPDTGRRPRRMWDGSRWQDDPERDRRVRRFIARLWTGVLIALTPLCVASAALANHMLSRARRLADLWDAKGPDIPDPHLFEPMITGGGIVAAWAIVMAVTAAGAAAAWRRLDRPLPPDAAFPPAGRPAVIAGPGWLANPDDPSSWRYWDGSTWTGWIAPNPASAGVGASSELPGPRWRSAVEHGG